MVFRVESKLVAFDKFREDLSDAESFKQRDQSEIHLDDSAEYDSFRRGVDCVFNLLGPDIFHGL